MLRPLPLSFLALALVMLALWPRAGWSQTDSTQVPPPYDFTPRFIPPRVVVEPVQDTFRVGEPVVIAVALANVSGTAESYRPVSPFTLDTRVTGPEGRRRVMFPAFDEGTDTPIDLVKGTGVPPGGRVREEMLLSYYYDLFVPGIYRVEIAYPIKEGRANLNVVARSGATRYGEATVGEVVGRTSFVVLAPTDTVEAQRADAFARAARVTMRLPPKASRSVPDSLTLATLGALAEAGGTLAEPAHFYAARYHDFLAPGQDEDWHREADRLGRTFFERYPTSAFLEPAIEVGVKAHYRIDPPTPGVPQPCVTVEALCDGDRFWVYNVCRERTTVRFEALPSGQSGRLTLDVDRFGVSQCALVTKHPGQTVYLFLDGDRVSAASANASTCTPTHLAYSACSAR